MTPGLRWARKALAGAALGALAMAPFAWFLDPIYLLFGAPVGAAIGIALGIPLDFVRRTPAIATGSLAGLAAGWLVARVLGYLEFGVQEMGSLGLVIAGYLGGAAGFVLGAVIGPVLTGLDRAKAPPDPTEPASRR